MFSLSNLNTAAIANTFKNSQLNASLEKLSSGSRINRAADDSAGLQIATRLASSRSAHSQINRNLNDGISYAQTADTGLQESAALLQRMRVLAVQAQNGINSDSDRAALNKEFNQLKNAVNAIAFNTEVFNRLPLVDDNDLLSSYVSSLDDVFTAGQTTSMESGLRSIAYIPAGSKGISINLDSFGADDDIQVFKTNGEHIIGTPLSDDAWRVNDINNANDIEDSFFLETNGYQPSATYDDSNLSTSGVSTHNGATFTFSGDGHPGTYLESLTIDETSEPLIISVVGNGYFNITVGWDSIGTQGSNPFSLGGVNITDSNQLGVGTEYISLDKTPATMTTLGIETTSLETQTSAEEALERIDSALKDIGESRAYYGAKINQMYSAYKQNAIMNENVSAASSRITDTDYAQETARLTQNQIVEQASVSLLAQSKQNDGQVLELLNASAQ